MHGIHHHSLIQNSFTGLKNTLFFAYSTLLFCCIFYQPLIFFYTLYSLAFPIVLFNHIVCSLFTLASLSRVQSLRPRGLYSPWNSPGQNIGAFHFSRGSSQLRDRTQVSHIAGRFSYQLSHRKAPFTLHKAFKIYLNHLWLDISLWNFCL